MSAESNALYPRYLGAAFIFQFVTSLTAGLLSRPILSGSIFEVMDNISNNLTQTRASILLFLLTSIGIIAMTSLLYVVLRDQNRAVALVAFGMWMAEAVMLSVKTLGLYALLTLSGDVQAGDPASTFGPVGALSLGFSQHAGDIDMLFFCVGAVLWYSMLFRSQLVPRPLSLWGLVAVVPVLLATVLLVWNRDLEPSLALYALYVPFELAIGLWLVLKGANVPAPHVNYSSSTR